MDNNEETSTYMQKKKKNTFFEPKVSLEPPQFPMPIDLKSIDIPRDPSTQHFSTTFVLFKDPNCLGNNKLRI